MVTRYFSRRFEDSLLAFRILEGTSDPQAPVNTESGPAADREASSGRWPPAIDRHPPATMSTDGAESNDLCELSLIMGDDQRDHRARVARICRGILVFSASKTFFLTSLHITKHSQKSTKPTNNVPRHVFSKSVGGFFLISQYFLFYANLTIWKYPPKSGFFEYIFAVLLDIVYARHPHTLSSGESQL